LFKRGSLISLTFLTPSFFNSFFLIDYRVQDFQSAALVSLLFWTGNLDIIKAKIETNKAIVSVLVPTNSQISLKPPFCAGLASINIFNI